MRPRYYLTGIVWLAVLATAADNGAASPSDATQSSTKPYAKFLNRWAYHVGLGRSPGLRSDIDAKRCALIVENMEEITLERTGFMGAVGAYNPELLRTFEKRRDEVLWPNVEKLIDFFRSKDLPIFFTTHQASNGLHPNIRLKEKNEFVIRKPHRGAFSDTELDKMLKERNINTIFVSGLYTSHSISITMLDALNRFIQAIVVDDACADPRSDQHEAIMKILALHGFATTTEHVISDYPWKTWVDTRPIPTNQTGGRIHWTK
ncbi:MAG: cysteine hydrolase [Armatimonadetes bacterium]|nr:cysteine hydrolase [Armatimonadota bacterium]